MTDDNSFGCYDSDQNYGREYTFGGGRVNFEYLKEPMSMWAVGLLCAVNALLFGWFIGLPLSVLFALWQDRYKRGYDEYSKGNKSEAIRLLQNARGFKIAYIVVLTATILISIILFAVSLVFIWSSIVDSLAELSKVW